MSKRSLTAAVVIAGAALMVVNGTKAQSMQYPDWSGQWERFVVRGIPGQPSHDQTKPWGFGQQARDAVAVLVDPAPVNAATLTPLLVRQEKRQGARQ
jgi:hypothetical protein